MTVPAKLFIYVNPYCHLSALVLEIGSSFTKTGCSLIVQIVGGPNKQEFRLRRMHLKFIFDEPLSDLSDIRIKLYDKFVCIVRGNEDLCIIRIHTWSC